MVDKYRNEMPPISMISNYFKSDRMLVARISGKLERLNEVYAILNEIEDIFSRIKEPKVWIISDYTDFVRNQRVTVSMVTAKVFMRLNRILKERTIGRIIVTKDQNVRLYEKLLAMVVGGSPKSFETLEQAMSYVRSINANQSDGNI